MKLGIFQLPYCNIGSIEAYCASRKFSFEIISQDSQLDAFDALVLPGVGVFGNAMDYLNCNHFDKKLFDLYSANYHDAPTLIGICLGMQLLFDSSEESCGVPGLSLIKGHCVKFPDSIEYQIPHLGWNTIHNFRNCAVTLPDMYFVHSYHCIPEDTNDILFTTLYDDQFISGVNKGSIYGFQFHPEKSGNSGYQLLDTVLGQC